MLRSVQILLVHDEKKQVLVKQSVLDICTKAVIEAKIGTLVRLHIEGADSRTNSYTAMKIV